MLPRYIKGTLHKENAGETTPLDPLFEAKELFFFFLNFLKDKWSEKDVLLLLQK